ncbi:hypothetical protein L1987_13464 [Smallanthus sonchifolius]|uniref:Uncharacterized protein n=1 Tax=Smallanthus sonchifolius TaxID=185202 RepID=A0ACB9JGJ2_9ASTR|nr:hypothetical protein L1987_13464 [Smallanthus sonchifolius]
MQVIGCLMTNWVETGQMGEWEKLRCSPSQVQGVGGFSSRKLTGNLVPRGMRRTRLVSLTVHEGPGFWLGFLRLPRERWFEGFSVRGTKLKPDALDMGEMIRESMKDLTKTRSLRK